jgi:peptidyl-prolyl cis-trans isomerase A (cyclophilin A)
VPTEHLNQKHTIFGQCDEPSINVVKAMARVQRDDSDKPVTPVILQKVTIVPEGQAVPPNPAPASQPSTTPQP